MIISSLRQAVERYETAIAVLEADHDYLSAEHVLEALIAREMVHRELEKQPRPGLKDFLARVRAVFTHRKPNISYWRLLRQIKRLDARLSQQQDSIKQVVNLKDWQVVLHAPERDWLWLLDAPNWRDRYDWLWRGLSIASLTASLSLIADIAARFLDGGPDLDGALAIIIPSVLALLTGGGALTKTGQQAIEHILTSWHIAKHWWDEAICALSLLLLLVLALFWFALPQIGLIYKNQADAAYCVYQQFSLSRVVQPSADCNPQLATAEKFYKRAISLDPDNRNVHYRLGRLQEELQEFQPATAHFKIAAKSGILAAYNGLTRIATQQGNYAQAGDWLAKCLTKADESSSENYLLERVRCDVEVLAGALLRQNELAKAYPWASLGVDHVNRALDITSLDHVLKVLDQDLDVIPNMERMTPGEQSEQRYALLIRYAEKRYTLLTYLGWSLLGKQDYGQAEATLREAIQIFSPERREEAAKLFRRDRLQDVITGFQQRALAHCVLAEALDKQNNPTQAKTEWELCSAHANLKDLDEAIWWGRVPIQRLRVEGGS